MFCRDINGSQTLYHYDSGDSMIILEVQICGFYLDNYWKDGVTSVADIHVPLSIN